MRGPRERKLRVVIDCDTVEKCEALDVLLRFGRHEDVEVIGTKSADGIGHLSIGVPEAANDLVNIDAIYKNHRLRTAVLSYKWCEEVARQDSGSTKETLRRLLLGRAAESLNADALATQDPYLLGRGRPLVERGNPMSPENAAALVGLYLRLRGDFTFDMGPHYTEHMDRRHQYMTAAWALLPTAWRCWDASVTSSGATGNQAGPLIMSVIVRLDRVLRARDRLHEQFLIPQDADSLDESLFYVDIALLQLVGAFDALARLAHLSAIGPKGERAASWRRDWLEKKLAPKEPRLAAIMKPNSAARDTLDLAALLRNSVHGEVLRGVTARGAASSWRGRTHNLVLLPATESGRMVAAARRRGGLDRWGLRPLASGEFVFSADRFIEALVPDAARALNRLMRAMPVDKLPGLPRGWNPQIGPGAAMEVGGEVHRRARCLFGL